MKKELHFKNLEEEQVENWGISLEEIPPEGLKIEFEEVKFLSEDIKILSPFKGVLELKKQGIEVKLTGFLQGKIELVCDRCLSEFGYKIKHKFEVLLKPVASLNVEGEKELQEEDMEVSFFENSWIDFAGILREEIFLSVPYKKLCKKDCKGLCPVCGKNLNKSTCGCEVKKKESPFAVLKEIFKGKLEGQQKSEKK